MSKLMFNGHSYTGGSINPNLATDVVYDNTTSGLVADNAQEAIDEINAKDASDIPYDNTASGLSATNVQGAIDEVSKRSFKQTLLIDTAITNAQSVTIPGFSNYDFVQVIIQGDNYNGISVFVPTVLSSIPNPFALYAINTGETFTGYSIHANGMIHNGIVQFNYLKISGWSQCIIRAYGIKYE